MPEEFDIIFKLGPISFNSKDATLLKTVLEYGSLNSAASHLGRSYSRAHKRICELEEHSGPLLIRNRGGHKGGGSNLTPKAYELLDHFCRMEATFSGILEISEIVLQGEVQSRNGEIATILTQAGIIKSLLFSNSKKVQVSFRSDSITLYAPSSAPISSESSALNRFNCVVKSINSHEAIAEVILDVGNGIIFVALISLESISNLNLKPGSKIVATFKATSTLAIPLSS